jgi:hypothetical protein
MATLIAIGPTYPPNTNAPIEPTVAMTALVRGFSRWKAVGVGGTRRAMRAASAGARSSATSAQTDGALATRPPG